MITANLVLSVNALLDLSRFNDKNVEFCINEYLCAYLFIYLCFCIYVLRAGWNFTVAIWLSWMTFMDDFHG